MSSSNPDSDRPPTDRNRATNPFVAFRHFADSQVSSLLDNVFGIFQSSPIRRQQAIDDFDSKLKQHDDMGQRIHDARNAMDLYVKASQNAEDEARPTRADPEDHFVRSFESIRDFRRTLQNVGLLDGMLRPSGIDVGYIFMSSYSPLMLEQQEMFQDQSGKMRAAFADLMSLQAGKGLLSDNTIEQQAQIKPLRWAADMTRMTAPHKAGWYIREDSDDDTNDTMRCLPLRLPSLLNRIYEESMMRAELSGDSNRGEDEDKYTIPVESTAKELTCQLIKSFVGDNDYEERQNPAEKNAMPEPQDEVLIAEPGLSDEQTETNDSRTGSCACLHCCFYERRKEEFRQWRREEDEAEEDAGGHANDELDDERTTNPTSELDQYHTLADYQAHLLKLEQQSKPRPELPTNQAAPLETKPITTKPSILSTLTTTEQRTLPDGTVTTKVVLKKRFSDGGEEVRERVHTQNGPSSQEEPMTTKATTTSKGQALISEVRSKVEKEKEKDKKKESSEGKRGWFWS